jgi:hypothetical protein
VTNDDIKEFSFDTLDNERIPFSLDRGSTFKTINQHMEVFDIWNEATYEQVSTTVFFYAFSYKEFLAEIEKAKNPDFDTYDYVNELEFNNLLQIYNETYFKENILIFYYKLEPNLSENYIYSVTSEDDVLTINVNRIESMLTALSFHRHIITIKKSDISGINHVDLIVRTIASPQASVTYYIKKEYIRDFYVNGKTLEDFYGLDNLCDIKIYTWSISVSLTFMNSINDEDLNTIIRYLNHNPLIKSVGYTGKDFINIHLNNGFYDKAIDRTIKITDFIDEEIINEYGLKMTMRNFSPIGYIEFILENKGKEYASQMHKDLQDGDYPFLITDELF